MQPGQDYKPIARAYEPKNPPTPPRDDQEDVVHFAERIAFEEQLAMPEIPPPPPPPEEYLRAQVREAHAILSRLHTIFGQQMPNNVYMAMAYLQIEITTAEKGGSHAPGQ